MASASPITRGPLTKISAFAVKQNKQKPKKNARPEVNRQQQATRASDTVMVSQLSDQCLPARGVLKMKKARGVLKMKNRLALKRTSLLRRNTQGRPAKKSKWIVQERTSSITSVDGNRNQILPKSPDLLTFINSLDEIANSRERASKLFEWLIAPIDPDVFFSNLWEKKPLLLRRHNPDYYRGLFSMEEFDRILHEEDIQYGMNIDVTSFSEDKRETHNGSGRAYPSVLWDFFQNGCSLRMLNPQSYSATLWKLLSLLQEHFGSMAGANVYVTPAGTQGFAPHYDDIEAFVLQIEGKKFWRVYDQQSEDVRLPRFSSQNFSQEELNRQPILEEVLEPGDVLYFPRGFVHQANCQPSTHSLHITISTFQRNTYGDLLEKLLPQTLQSAIEQDVELRRGLPRDLLHFMGVEHIEKVDPRRKSFHKNVRGLMDKIFDNVPLDAAVDQFAKGFLHDCLPPPLTKYEWLHSVHGLPTHWKDGKVHGILEPISGKQAVRLLRDLLRLCAEDDEVRLYHTIENARTYHGKELASITLNYEVVGNVEFLLNSYPEYVTVESMPEGSLEDKVNLAMDLFENGILIFGDLHTS